MKDICSDERAGIMNSWNKDSTEFFLKTNGKLFKKSIKNISMKSYCKRNL